jgi:leucyl-tRNA synthetase
LYARFFTKVLKDFGYISFDEPFKKLRHQGMILAEDGRKMSKRYGNVINPDDVVATYGADAFRTYEMFMGPFENTVAWSTSSITGTARFIERVYKIGVELSEKAESPAIDVILHQTIKKVGEDIEAFKFNTAVSQMMIFLNAVEKEGSVTKKQWEMFLKILAPFAPHVTDELWEMLGHTESIHTSAWPSYDPAKTVANTVTVAVQINGKTRATVELSTNASQDEALTAARAHADVAPKLAQGKEVRAIYVPGKIINFVVEMA